MCTRVRTQHTHIHAFKSFVLCGWLTGAETFFHTTKNPFEVLDTKNMGVINGKELRNVLTTLAEAISDDEFDKLFDITSTPNDDGDVDYKQLYQTMVDMLRA